MFELLEKLRNQPVALRKRVAFIIAFSLAGVILVIWISIIFPDFHSEEALESHARAVVQEASPFGGFSDTVGKGFSKIGEQFGELKNAMGAFSTAPAYYISTTTQ